MGFERFARRLALRGKTFVRATSASNQFAGRLSVASGDATATVSTSVVKSESLIFHSWQSETAPAVGQAFSIRVSTTVDGGYFQFAATKTSSAGGTNNFSTGGTITWEIRN